MTITTPNDGDDSSSSTTNHNKRYGRSESCSSEGSLFFADMTLDLSLAKMEATPRTDKLFASMVAENPGRGKDTEMGGNDQDEVVEDEDLLRNVPPMPLFGETMLVPTAGGDGGTRSVASILKFATRIASDKSGENDTGSGAVNIGRNNHQRHENDNHYDCGEHGEEANYSTTNNCNSSSPPLHFSHGTCINNINNTTTIINSNNSSYSNILRPSRRPPRRPRDVSYTILACIVLPTGLLLPHLYYPNEYINHHNEDVASGGTNRNINHSWSQMAMSSTSHTTILFSTLIATLLSLFITRLLYNHPGGGGGNDKRHAYVGRIILTSSHLCIWLYPILAIYIWIMLPNERRSWGMALPLGMTVRDACFRMKGPSPAFRTTQNEGGYRLSSSTSSSSSHADRRTFFRVLAVTTLDIVSRSLRRKSFVRAISLLLILQFVVVSLWWGALSVVLSVKMHEDDATVSKFVHFLWLLITLISGKWATEIIVRLIGYVTSGGVASWFGSQTTLIMERMRVEEERRAEEEERRKRRSRQKPPQCTPTKVLETISENEDANTEDCSGPDSLFCGDDDNRDYMRGNNSMPEAYRMANASAYASVMDFDEFARQDDDDDDDDDVYDETADQSGNSTSNPTSTSFQRQSSVSSIASSTATNTTTTVKSFLKAGCTIGLGSVAQCGLLGGLAQMLWSFVRNINAMGLFLRRFQPQSMNSSRGFRGMEISTDNSVVTTNPHRWKHAMEDCWRKLDAAIRSFVRCHSDLAMSHVAMYYKSYQMAAHDVAALIETSGTCSIIFVLRIWYYVLK